MVRESSIAEKYCKQIIDKIKQETKMIEEQNNSIHISSSSSSPKFAAITSKQDQYGNSILIHIILLLIFTDINRKKFRQIKHSNPQCNHSDHRRRRLKR
ncbi:unnamed protein product [Rotaria sordida]|uniref:Uncharacterized protein n=1 Tax=Rotaria sordida TaxID=392033 RepID=A0A816D144_9BILA|nr:unnamed protein product [Rotaria sordida]CAF1632199.1 unnamed protein product [Rotaria sordida]